MSTKSESKSTERCIVSEGAVDRGCRDAVDGLHEVMKLLDLAKINLGYKDKRYTYAFAFFTL